MPDLPRPSQDYAARAILLGLALLALAPLTRLPVDVLLDPEIDRVNAAAMVEGSVVLHHPRVEVTGVCPGSERVVATWRERRTRVKGSPSRTETVSSTLARLETSPGAEALDWWVQIEADAEGCNGTIRGVVRPPNPHEAEALGARAVSGTRLIDPGGWWDGGDLLLLSLGMVWCSGSFAGFLLSFVFPGRLADRVRPAFVVGIVGALLLLSLACLGAVADSCG